MCPPEPVQSIPATEPDDSVFQSIDRYKIAADRARLAYANETALRYYSLALECLSTPPTPPSPALEFDLLAGRQACLGLLGLSAECQTDLGRMAQLAVELGDVARQVQVANQQVILHITLGNYLEAEQSAVNGLKLARKQKDSGLEAWCLLALGAASSILADFIFALVCHKKALRLFRKRNELSGIAYSYWRMGDCLKDMGQSAASLEFTEKAYVMFRSLGDQYGQAHCLNTLGIITSDQAFARSYYEDALLIFFVGIGS